MNPMLNTMIILLVGELLLINMYMKNFLANYVLVRMKRDAGVLVQIHGKRGIYYRAGKLGEDELTYKISRKQKGTIKTKDAHMFRALGVNMLITEEGSDLSMNAAFTGVPGAKPIEYDNLLVRALTKPQISSAQDKMLIMMILGVGGVVLFIAWKIMGMETTIAACRAGANVISGGNV